MPLANAGPDQTVASGAEVQLEGTGSDPDGDALRYEWKMVQTPDGSSAQLGTPASPVGQFCGRHRRNLSGRASRG
ncbi:MAG: PKD domain-containing protein [Candidatus Manganitrophus sp.]|nr:PKD domain-containing protein [Candidatus Manganitrophus sp.]